MGADLNGRQAQNWGPFQSPRTDKAISGGHQAVDSKQKVLFDAISQVVLAAAADQRGEIEDKRYRYIVDLILDRVRAALAKQSLAISKDNLQTITESNMLLVQSMTGVVSELLKLAFKNLEVTVNEDQQDDFLDEIDDKLSNAVDDIVERISENSGNQTSSDSSSKSKDALVTQIKSYFAKQFGENSSKSKNSSAGNSKASQAKAGFKMSSILLMQKSLSALNKNQNLINTGLTKKFESTSARISGNVEVLDENTQGSLDKINDKISSPMKSVKGLFKKLASGITGLVSGGIKLAFKGVTKIFGGLVSGLKWTTKKLASFLKSPLKIVGEFLKKVLLSPFGLYAIGYLAGWMYKKFIKPLWDWAKPIREAISKWFGGEISFKEMAGQIWTHLKKTWDDTIKPWMSEKVWEPIKAVLLDFWNNGKIGSISVKGIVTGIGVVVGAYAVYKIFKIIRGIWRFVKVTYKAFKFLGKVIGAIAKFFHIPLPSRAPVPKGPKNTKGGKNNKKKNQKNKKPRNKPKKPKGPKLKQPKAPAKPGLFRRAADGTKNLVSKAASKVASAGKSIANAVGISTKGVATAAKTTGKVLKGAAKFGGTALKVGGGILAVADGGMDLFDSYDKFKSGDTTQGIAKAGLGTAKIASLAGGPIAMAAVMAADYANDKLVESTKAYEEMEKMVGDQLYDHGKAIGGPMKTLTDAIKKQGEKNPLDKILDKYKNFDKAKAEADPLTKKMKELQEEIESSSKWYNKAFTGEKVKNLHAELNKIKFERDTLLAKAGLTIGEIERGKLQLENSREVKHLMTQLTDEQKAKYAQLQEISSNGPDGLKLQMSQESILEAMQKELTTKNDEASKKIDGVNDGIKDVKKALTEEIQKVGLKFEKVSNGDGTATLNFIQSPVQVPQTGIGLDLQ